MDVMPIKATSLTVFTDNCGTCSTKHALLKKLVDENGQPGFRLMLGIYKMNAANTRMAGKVLKQYDLSFIPEAHNYLRYGTVVIDRTAEFSFAFEPDLLEETEITPEQITDFKIASHRRYLDKWRTENDIKYNLDEIWAIREACIAALAKK